MPARRIWRAAFLILFENAGKGLTNSPGLRISELSFTCGGQELSASAGKSGPEHHGAKMARQWENSDVRKRQIAEAALSIMTEEGFDKISIESVAHRVGLTPSGIYRHFAGRDEVLDAVLPVLGVRMQDMLVQAEQASPLAIEKLHFFFLALLSNIYAQRTLPEVMLSAEYFRNRQERRAALFDIVSVMRRYVCEKIAEGQAAHHIARDIDPDAFWLLMFGAVRAAMIYWTLSEKLYDVEAHGASTWQALARLLAR